MDVQKIKDGLARHGIVVEISEVAEIPSLYKLIFPDESQLILTYNCQDGVVIGIFVDDDTDHEDMEKFSLEVVGVTPEEYNDPDFGELTTLDVDMGSDSSLNDIPDELEDRIYPTHLT